MSNRISWKERAEDALGLTRIREAVVQGHWDSATHFEINRRESFLPEVMAALAQAYGEGLAEGRAEKK